jgi:hypothetical protein
MSNRNTDQLMDELVYAVACVVNHYGPMFNESGLEWLRKTLEPLRHHLWCDACYTVDVYPGDEYEDFHQRIIWPPGWDTISFSETQA